MKKLNKHSSIITQDNSQPAAQAMLYAIGFTDDDFNKPLIGIASTGYEGNPCNMHLNHLATKVKSAINKSNIDELKNLMYAKVREIHITRFPYNNFLYPEIT